MAEGLTLAGLVALANVGFVWIGYVLTAAALGGYVARLFVRAGQARRRAATIAAKRPPQGR